MGARTYGLEVGAPYTSQVDLGLDTGPEPGIEGEHSRLTLSLGDIEGKLFPPTPEPGGGWCIEGERCLLQCPQVYHRCAHYYFFETMGVRADSLGCSL